MMALVEEFLVLIGRATALDKNAVAVAAVVAVAALALLRYNPR
jgi:hypothetical protein